MAGAKVLVLGCGAREQALSWKLAESEEVAQIFVSPGNAGTSKLGPKVNNITLNVREQNKVVEWCRANGVSLVVVGPEDPLADGISDTLTKAGISCFGPMAAAAKIEASKEFAKDLMTRHNIPTARWASFTDSELACQFIQSAEFPALVVKASGLAAGKGVIVASNKEEAIAAVKDMKRLFGEAGSVVVVEELLEGEEISCLAFCDGKSVVCMPPAQDHKRLLNGDKGPNTGGMGAYCPCPLVNQAELELVKTEVLQKAVDALREAGTPFVGVLYAGLMLTKDGPKVLEFNCRFGDPETQVILPLLKTDLYTVISHCVRGDLDSISVEFDLSSTAVGVVLASEGYPGSYPKGLPITGLESLDSKPDVNVFLAGAALNGDTIVTSGGRVLTVVAKSSSLELACIKAQTAAQNINFEGRQFRQDIGHKALKLSVTKALTYKDSGVDIDAGDALVERIKPLARATVRLGCCSELGLFGALYDVKDLGYTHPVLCVGTDGVGTKLMVSLKMNVHNTVGIDLVAMVVNDLLCCGAEPVSFIDYYACGKLDVDKAVGVLEGITNGCKEAGCALQGGETAELPGLFHQGDHDLGGFGVGVVEKSLILPKFDDIKEGDVVIGLTSSGLHSNGFSLARKVFDNLGITYDMKCPFDATKTLGECLLTPTKIYIKSLLPIVKRPNKVKALAHITGGGLPGNIERVIPKKLRVILDASQWVIHPIFGYLATKGNIGLPEMLRTFNCGIGMVAIVDKDCVSEVMNMIRELGEEPLEIGKVVSRNAGDTPVEVLNIASAMEKSYNCCTVDSHLLSIQKDAVVKKRVAVLISGSGTNLQALINHTKNPANKSAAEIVLVLSNVSSAYGLKRAEAEGITTMVVSNKNYKTREDFDDAVLQALVKENIEIVCLAGFMRILTGGFVNKWKGKMINIHPSLLPSFKGANAQKMAVDARVRVSGCTVHFVAEEVDAGAIIEQQAVNVYPHDTEATLSERILVAEHQLYPKAMELVASGAVRLSEDGCIEWC